MKSLGKIFEMSKNLLEIFDKITKNKPKPSNNGNKIIVPMNYENKK